MRRVEPHVWCGLASLAAVAVIVAICIAAASLAGPLLP